MATLIKIIDEGTSHTTATPASRSHAVQTRVYSGVYTDAQAEDLSTALTNTAHADDANLICSNPTVTKVGNGIAIATCYYRKASSYATADPPVLYFNLQGVEAVKLPAIDSSGEDYGTAASQLVFKGHAPKNTFYRVVYDIKARGDDVTTVDMSSIITHIGKVNTSAWNGLAAKTLLYNGPSYTVYEDGAGYTGRGWLSYTYKQWLVNHATPASNQPMGLDPHSTVIVTEDGTIEVISPLAVAIPDPFA